MDVTYPGVYIEETASSVRTIVGVSTSTEAFVGCARAMPAREPRAIIAASDALLQPSLVERAFADGGEAWCVVAHAPDRARLVTLIAGKGAAGRATRELLDALRPGARYTLDLGALVSKYVGETEKHLSRLFDSAEQGGAILFFDEAEALFGKRADVRDSHDRYGAIQAAHDVLRDERALVRDTGGAVVGGLACELTLPARRERAPGTRGAGKGMREALEDARVGRSMSAQFQLFKDTAGEWRWRLLAENHESIAISSEAYVAKADALHGIELVRTMNGKTEVYEDARGEWRWRMTHANGNIIATGGEGYVKRSDCEYGLSLTEKLAKDAPVREV